MNDIAKYCKELVGSEMNGGEFAQHLMNRYGSFGETGDIICLKTRGGVLEPLFIPTDGNVKNCGRYMHHFIFVQDEKVYDIRHNNIGINFNEYIKMLEKVVPSGIRVDMELSTTNMGLPTSRNKM